MSESAAIDHDDLFDSDYRVHAQSILIDSTSVPGGYSVDRLLATIREGVAMIVVTRIARRYQLTDARLSTLLGLSTSTLKRRRAAGGRLTRDESDRFARVAGLYAMAEDVLGSPVQASRWMAEPHRSLAYESPNDYAQMDAGAREIEDLLGRIAHGIAA